MDWSQLSWTNHKTVATLEQFLQQSLGVDSEAEVRLGHSQYSVTSGSTFVSAIDGTQYKHLYNRLKAYKGWEASGYHKRLIDYFYTHAGKSIRTTVTTRGKEFTVVHQEKKQGTHLLVPLQNLDLRVSLKDEVVVTDVPKHTKTSWVRIKDRHSFVKHNWCYDFTIVRQAITEALAEEASPTYEVEVECLAPMKIVQDHSYEYLAVDFLMKIHSLFPNEKIVLSS